jgi:hypothetical protein
MTTLFKTEKDVKVSFPRININDDFKNKFFKLARYISKIADVNSIDILECVKTLERKKGDFSAYKVSAFEDMATPAKYSSKIILEGRAKTENLSDVKFLYANGETKKEIYLIVPSCPATNDGCGFYARYQVDYANCKLYSIGFLLIASTLESVVRKFISDESYSIFNYFSKSWKYSKWLSVYETALDTIINVEYNHSLNREYARESGKTISTFRTDKKYQDEALNKSTLFNKMGFRKVEIDTQKYEGETFDYEEFSKVEQDFLGVLDRLPQAKAQPELKFRRLGKHKAWGIYSPALNILAVDVRHTESFIHEYGHYLDFKHGDEVYSEMSTFFPIIKAYEKKLTELAEDSKYAQKLTAKRMSYYLIPTEVFARAFELWVSGTIVSDATIISSTERYNSQPEYIAFSHIKELVFSFFNAIFPNVAANNQTMVAELKSQKETTVSKAKVWEEIAPTNTGEQLSLF